MASYDDSLYSDLASALGLPALPERGAPKIRATYWDIEDHLPNSGVYLLHYKKEALRSIVNDPDFAMSEKTALFQLRGLIVDTRHPGGIKVVCRSFGYTPSITLDSLRTGLIKAKDQVGVDVAFDIKDAIIQPCYEGTLIRRWKHSYIDDDGKLNTQVFMSSHRRISVEFSTWSKSKPFSELYKELKGPSDDELFSDKLYSNICYVFILCHPSVIAASKVDVGKGWLINLRQIMTNPVTSDSSVEWDQHWKKHHEGKELIMVAAHKDDNGDFAVPIPPPSESEGYIYGPSQLGGKYSSQEDALKVANMILSDGYSGYGSEVYYNMDYRLRPGEPIIVLYGGTMIKVSPLCYQWRVAMVNGNGNRYNQFTKLIDYSAVGSKEFKGEGQIFDGTEHKYSYDDLFPHLGAPTDAQFKEFSERKEPMWLLPTFAYDPLTDRDARIRNILMCYAMALPVAHQLEAFSYYDLFTSRRAKLIETMIRQYAELETLINSTIPGKRLSDDIRFGSGSDKTLNRVGQNVQRLITQSRIFAKKLIQDNKTQLSENVVARNNLRNLLLKENGSSLYGLCKKFLDPPRTKLAPSL